MVKMKKISRKGSHDCHVILESMDDIYDKLDELIEGYNESLEGIEKRWAEQIKINEGLTKYCDSIFHRAGNP